MPVGWYGPRRNSRRYRADLGAVTGLRVVETRRDGPLWAVEAPWGERREDVLVILGD